MECPLWSKVGFSVVVYCVSVSAVPIYNKLVFSGPGSSGPDHGLAVRSYPYPIATAFLQLGLVAVCLAVANIVGHLWHGLRGLRRESWILGPHLGYKLQHIAPVELLFGLKYGVTNWGLQLVPVGMHLLLQSSDLLWTVIAARILNKEAPGLLEYVSALLSTTGSVLIAAHAIQTLDAPLIPLLVNLLTPLVLALCVSTLRSGTKELFRPDNRLGGSVTAAEFTALKMVLSSFTALALAMLLESGAAGVSLVGGDGVARAKPAWWVVLREDTLEGVAAVVFGGIFVLVFQVNLTWLAHLTSAMTVGIVGGLKVVPQWLLNALFQLTVNLSPLNLLGAALILAASTLYAAAMSSDYVLVLNSTGLGWQLRDEYLVSREDSRLEKLLPGRLRDPSAITVLSVAATPKTLRVLTRADTYLELPAELLETMTADHHVGPQRTSRDWP